MTGFDASLYKTIPQTSAGGTVALVRATITASKGVNYPPATKALKRLRQKGEILRTIHAAIAPTQEKINTRTLDIAMDRAWHALERRLSMYADLPPEFASDQAEADEIHRTLFPHGMGFLTLPYANQWAEGAAIFQRIAEQGIASKIDHFAGAPFLAQVRARHAAYGAGLGITKAKPAAIAPESLAEPLRETRAALLTYAKLLVVAVENEDLAAKVAQGALAPIADLRLKVRSVKKAKPTEPAEEPASTEPLPPVT
ncbi:MAG: hypothetical protein FWD69_07450 [Polyangiaceae bacterium]|nr:hypothetical protein [Polyangiaceae bacterium]